MPKTITKHEPSIPILTILGKADCIAWIDYDDQETDQIWECVLKNGAVVFLNHRLIRFPPNAELERNHILPLPEAPDYLRAALMRGEIDHTINPKAKA